MFSKFLVFGSQNLKTIFKTTFKSIFIELNQSKIIKHNP